MKCEITKYKDLCIFCGKPRECDHHLVFGSSARLLADEDSLIVPSCNKCHNLGLPVNRIHDNVMAEKMSKMIGQLAWEKQYIIDRTWTDVGDEAREAFRQRYGKSYL